VAPASQMPMVMLLDDPVVGIEGEERAAGDRRVRTGGCLFVEVTVQYSTAAFEPSTRASAKVG
jgi:hypothetical protein